MAQRILRHSRIAMTLEVCAEASEEEIRTALGKLSAAVGGTGSRPERPLLYFSAVWTKNQRPRNFFRGLWAAVHSAGFEPATF
ncbi:hypothetical protein ACFVIM_26270 [Streptomyces sp. NPDC057638]|uniref:hypothetical protein n=1 Tax=Streptomyces sp. NPDC057638 TaxID=3346190 RepID=UPI0036A92E1C